jgi:hypothetical protein
MLSSCRECHSDWQPLWASKQEMPDISIKSTAEKMLYRITNKLYFIKNASMRRTLPAFGLSRIIQQEGGHVPPWTCRMLTDVDYFFEYHGTKNNE